MQPLWFQKPRHKNWEVKHVAIAKKVGLRKNESPVYSIASCCKRIVKCCMRFIVPSRLDFDGQHVSS